MTFAPVGNLTPFGSAAGVTTLTFTGLAIPAGALIVLGWCGGAATLTFNIADNSTQGGAANSYTKRTTLNGTGFTSGTAYCFVTRALLTTDTITITLSASTNRVGGVGTAYTATSGNIAFDKAGTVSNAVVSPVTTSATGALSVAGELGVGFGYWLGGAVASGKAHAAPSGWSLHTGGLSGGATTRVEANIADGNIATSTSFTDQWTYTSITVANGEVLTFLELPANNAFSPGRSESRRGAQNYRGSYSAVSNAADEAIGLFVPAAVSRQELNYASPVSRTFGAFDNPTAPIVQAIAPVAASRGVDALRARGSFLTQPLSAPDVPGIAPVVVSRQQTSPTLRSFLSQPYAPDVQQAMVPAVTSRQQPQPNPRSYLANPIKDSDPPSIAAVVASRQQSPSPSRSFLTQAFAAPAQAFGTDYVQSIVSRGTAYYHGSYSAVSNAADESIDSWAAVVQSAQAAAIRRSLSQVVPAWSAPVAAPTGYAPIAQSMQRPYYDPAQSLIRAAWDDHACTTLLPDTMLGPDTMLYPDLCPQVEIGFVTQSRVTAYYRGPRSFTVPVFDTTTATFQNWAAVAQSRVVMPYAPPRSFLAPVYFAQPAVAGQLVVQSILRRPLDLYAGRSRTFQAFAPTPPAAGYVAVAQSRGTLRQLANLSRVVIPPGDPAIITTGPNMGGGGEWVIWGKPYFPGNDQGNWRQFPKPYFRKPTRRVP